MRDLVLKRARASLCVLAWLWLLGAAAASWAAPSPLTAETTRLSLEGRLGYVADPGNAMAFETVRQQAFTRLPDFRSLGYATGAHWFHATLERRPQAPTRWILVIGMPDLEEVDIWIGPAGGDFRHHALGYHRPFRDRPLQTREFAVPFEAADRTEVYVRVRTKNAVNVHAQVWQADAFSAHETRSNFHRGLYFGMLLIAVVLYLILAARLRDAPMGAYAGYLASQTLLHLGSSGYLPVLLPDGPWFADALPRIGWLGSAICIALMWDRLLELKRSHARIHRLYLGTVFLHLALLPFALLPHLVGPWLLHVVKLANALNSLNFFISMGLLLVLWRRSRKLEFMLYLAAFIVPAIATVISMAVNTGVLRQDDFTSSVYPLAMLVHVLVMSLGLAMRLRQLQHDKAAAERSAAVAAQRAEEQRRFVAMLSHEFGNPLAAIDRATQVIQLKAPDLPPADAQRLAQIRANVATLSGYVDNFLMTEALGHGALVVSREPCALQPLLDGAIRSQGEGARGRIRLIACPQDATFALDPNFIGVAIGNLLANALRYAPPDSTVELGASLDGRGLRIRVADRGPGLRDDELDKLGTPYFRATSSLGKKGSGLGYYFTRHIVEAHGGTLVAQSLPGQGLQVEIRLPHPPRAATSHPGAVPAAGLQAPGSAAS